MDNQELKEMTKEHAVKENKRKCKSSLEFTQQHKDSMEPYNWQQELLKDLAMELRETM